MTQLNLDRTLLRKDLLVVFRELKDRKIHPAGKFDKKGRFYAHESFADFIDVRSPSARYPYSEMVACRTLKFVTKIANHYDPKTIDELRSIITTGHYT